jgi:hypothetical protein
MVVTLLRANGTLMNNLVDYLKLDNRVREVMSPAVHAEEKTSRTKSPES